MTSSTDRFQASLDHLRDRYKRTDTVEVSAIGGGGGGAAPANASYVVMALNASLTAERVLAATSPLALTDGGAEGNATIAFSNQSANTVLAGPVSGGAAAPSFRALVEDDLPTHDIITKHSDSGLTVGHVIRATGVAAFAWQQLQHTDLGGVTSDQHHAQSHVLATTAGLGADHTTSGLTAGQYLRATSATTAAFQAIPAGEAGTIVVTHGLVGGGDLPATINIDQRGELRSSAFTKGESHGLAGTLSVVNKASALAEAVTVI